ncbi:MAG TPA: cell division protein FtsA [Victivallales bacterium]|nr:cell division protein FtsA [Victivallales bacterium]HPO90207.1 cell division protein FtsA [Victivallales bacterium]HRR27724.1 cell division protein FtsA [Victivallales bacterium]HRU00247.1 cell division protein FtsA [Victivallales bacterium]
MFKKKEVITAVDIGTSKISVLIGEADPSGNITALGLGERETNDAIIKGEIRKFEDVVEKLSAALGDAVVNSDREINSENIFFSVTGKGIKAQESMGAVTILNEERRITNFEINEAVKNSKQCSLPPNNIAINFVLSDFIIDGHKRVEDPKGLSASKLESLSFCVYGNASIVENYKNIFSDVGYDIKHKADIFAPLASSRVCLSEDDLRNGVLLVDMGAGTTEYAIFHGNGFFNCGVIQVGCDHIANDISAAFDIHISEARKMIVSNLLTEDFLKEQYVILQRSGISRRIPTSSLESVMKLRINEVFEILNDSIGEKELKQHIGNGVILSGGGANIATVIRLAEDFFQTTVRRSGVRSIDGTISKLKDPRYCCLAGLLKYGSEIKLSGKSSGIIQEVDKWLWKIITKSWKSLSEAVRI